MKKLLLLLMIVPMIGFGQCISGDCENGYGNYVYSGEFRGDRYVGEFKDGKRHGQGTYTFTDGQKYVGECRYDMWEGVGTFTYPNGSKYVGQFKNSQRHGYGSYTFPDGAGDFSYYINDKETRRLCDF